MQPPPPSPGGEERGRGADGALLTSTLLLVVLLAAMDLWATHHFDVGIRDPGALAVLLAAVGAGWGLVGWVFTREEKERAESRIRRLLRGILRGPAPVLVLYAAAVVAVLVFSSVTVVGEPGSEAVAVTLTALRDSSEVAGGTLDGGRRQLRFGVETSPMAGPYEVRAAGYLPVVVEAAPLVGVRIRLGRDVARAPGLLVRPAGPLLGQLRNGGRILVLRQRGGRTEELARSRDGEVGSFLLGRPAVSLSEREPVWERQLLAAGVTDLEALNRHLEDWSATRVLPFDGDLARGDTLLVQLRTRSDQLSVERRLVVGARDVEDVFLRPSMDPGGSP